MVSADRAQERIRALAVQSGLVLTRTTSAAQTTTGSEIVGGYFADSSAPLPDDPSGEIDFRFSPEALCAEARKVGYGKVTPAILNEIRLCLSDSAKQLIIDETLLALSYNASSSSSSTQPQTQSLVNERQSSDRSHFDLFPAAVVVYASSTEEVSAVMTICHRERIPVTPSGTRTGLEGASLCIAEGIVLDLSRMKKVLRLCRDEMLVEVQPGIEKTRLGAYLSKEGLFFPVDPGSNACMGGYANTGASGTLSYKYGTMRENCRSMTVVLSDGRIMRTRTRAAKSSAGYNLHQLFIGSEGTLCVVTELVLRVLPLPQASLAARACFPSSRAVTDCVTALIAAGVSQLARAELLNTTIMRGVNLHSGTSYPEAPTLFLEFHGPSAQDVAGAAEVTRRIAETHGSIPQHWASTSDKVEMDTMWQARRDGFFAAFKVGAPQSVEGAAKIAGGKLAQFVTDVCVPLPRLSEVLDATEKDFAASSYIPCPIIGHVADGNFHCMIPYNSADPEEVKTVTRLNARMVRRAIAVGGTCSGEHGVGLGKMQFLEEERGPVAMDAIRRVKQALDPRGILNPFKVFTPLPCEDACPRESTFMHSHIQHSHPGSMNSKQ